MLKNYFTIAVRHLARHKLFSVINICCLSIGITFSMLIGIFINNEKNVNADIKNIDRQYVIKSKWKVKNMGLDITTIGPLAKTLKEEYSNLVTNYYRFNPVTNVVSAGTKHFKENISIGDTSLISMYGFKLLHGNEKQAFSNNNSAVITETMALKLFGNKNAVNKTITITNTTGSTQDYIVSAVLKTMPYNSVNNFLGADGYHVFLPFEGNKFFDNDNYAEAWDNIYIVGMIELKPGILPQDITKAVMQTVALHAPDNIRSNLEVQLSPLKDYYLKDNNGAVQKMITALSLVALFILLMAIINFININIGTSSYRLKEIGLRKVFGSRKIQLIIQNLTEGLILTFIAGFISIAFYELLRPVFNQLLNTRLDPFWEFNFAKTLFLILLLAIVGFMAGIYPAFVLSSSKVISSVKGKMDSAKGGLFLRKTLLVVQFTLTVVVFISALGVSKQVSYFFNRDLGYNKDQLLIVTAFPKQWDSAGVLKMETIRNGLMQTPAVRNASLSFEIPERTPPNTTNLVAEDSKSNQPVVIPTIPADENYAATFGLQMKEGTFFNYSRSNFISGEVVLNETAAKALGWTSATGKKVKRQTGGGTFTLTVAGVVKDFNYSTMQESIGPLAFMHVKDTRSYRYLSIKLSTANISGTIGTLKEKWKTLSPDAPFDYFFMDDKFQSLYKSELQLKKAANIATILNLVIVLLGVFGVVAFTLTRRTKEIAVRKVLGASVATIISLFMKEFLWVIIIAGLIACPIAWFIMHGWLSDYAYRISLTATPFIISVAGLALITALLITLQTIKAGTDNPVKSLRTE